MLKGGVIMDVTTADQARMTKIRQRRERYAFAEPTGPKRWVEPSGDRPDEAALNQVLADALGRGPPGDVLDIGDPGLRGQGDLAHEHRERDRLDGLGDDGAAGESEDYRASARHTTAVAGVGSPRAAGER